ncbi:AraC family transcriptional regulator [Alcanivorax xiamenensis]|uniref:AraC family transcriptional regulator n=1 Tax=Alcanivorax xiamenensis TaxID=1177156 RepID=A0ABQ6Y6G0_9GAMM|nr:AraC family transcriptional regulator [Alcanivorax xiamenensis]KAF0804833.1 AraC family transcriptional regulator [Alcanivorax xiamenensis]
MSPAQFWRDPALPFVESRRACRGRACYRAHSHRTWSIGVVDGGRSRFTSLGIGRTLLPGTLISIPDEQVHACNPVPGGDWSYQMLYLDPQWLGRVLGEMPPRRVEVGRDPVAYAAFRKLNRCLFSAASPAVKERHLTGFLRAQWWRGEPLEGKQTGEPGELEAARRALRGADQTIPLEDLAAANGLSRYQLIRRFRRHLGLTPHAYGLDQRIDRARALLRAGLAPAEVAQTLGFTDQSHFQRAFKERVAATPGQYRRVAVDD